MGQILSQPITEKHSEEGGDSILSYGLSCMQGWRISMEDSHSTILNLNDGNDSQDQVSFFGVYDGHGGEKVALFTGERLHDIIKSTKSYHAANYNQALKDGFLACDKAISEDINLKNDESGCAATSVIITPTTIFCGNAGDSRTVLCSGGYAKPLSYDHKPSNEGEKARICLAGGYVDIGRVNGNLALSRGIGDFEFKKDVNLAPEEQIVTAYPDVIEHTITSDDEFIILACDGIWDCLTSQQAVEVVRRGIQERKELKEICEIMMEICLAPTSGGSGIGCDNMSVIILALLKGKTLEQWYEDIILKISNEQGTISPPYEYIHKELYGHDAELNSSNQSAEEVPKKSLSTTPQSSSESPFSLQKLLESNAITNQNGVLYLDSSSASSLLAHFGVSHSALEDGEIIQDDNDSDIEETEKIELIDDNDDNDSK